MKNFNDLSPTEKSIRLSWAINNVTALVSANIIPNTQEAMDRQVDILLKYYNDKMLKLEKEAEEKEKVEIEKQRLRNIKSADRREMKEKTAYDVRDEVDGIADFNSL